RATDAFWPDSRAVPTTIAATTTTTTATSSGGIVWIAWTGSSPIPATATTTLPVACSRTVPTT
ncbi:hypothetical protein BDZ94DRAFT_1226535, partial [Collybia nuda]